MRIRYRQWLNKLLPYFFFFLFTGVVLWRVCPWVNPIPQRDSGVFQYVGWRILQGEVPYKDIWDHKPPVIYFINALGLLIGKGSSWGVWLLEWISLFVASITSYKILKSDSGQLIGYFGTSLWLYCIPLLISDGNTTTEYGISLQFLCILFFLKLDWEICNKKVPFILGLLGCMLFMLKQPLIGLLFSICLCILIRRLIQNKLFWAIQEIFLLFLGASCILISFLMYFYLNDSLVYFWNDAFLYNYFYSQSDITEKWNSIINGLTVLYLPGLTLWGISGWILAILLSFRNKSKFSKYLDDNQLLIVLIISFPIEIFLVSISGRTYKHYYLPLIPILVLLSSFFIKFLTGNSSYFGFRGLLRHCILVLTYSVFPVIFFFSGYGEFIIKPFILTKVENRTLSSRLVEYLEKNSTDEDTVLILGAETSINFVSKRSAPTRFVYQYPLVKTGFDSSEYEAEFFRDIEQNKPRIIVDATSTNLAFTTGTIGRLENTYRGQGFNQRVFQTDYFRSSCRYDRKFGEWTAYLCE